MTSEAQKTSDAWRVNAMLANFPSRETQQPPNNIKDDVTYTRQKAIRARGSPPGRCHEPRATEPLEPLEHTGNTGNTGTIGTNGTTGTNGTIERPHGTSGRSLESGTHWTHQPATGKHQKMTGNPRGPQESHQKVLAEAKSETKAEAKTEARDEAKAEANAASEAEAETKAAAMP